MSIRKPKKKIMKRRVHSKKIRVGRGSKLSLIESRPTGLTATGTKNIGISSGDSATSFRNFFLRSLVLLGFLVGTYLSFKGFFKMGLGLISAAFILVFIGSFFRKIRSDYKFGWVVLGWIMVAAALSVVHDYGDVLPQGLVFQFPSYAGLLFLMGFLVMFLGFRYSPDNLQEDGDLGRWPALLGLTFLLGLHAFSTFINLGVPYGYYCDEMAEIIRDACTMKDLHIYSIIFPGFREPANIYITVFLWNLFPGESAFHMQRISGEIMALGAIWLMYLLGKEVGNRKIGLLFAALGSASKWMPAETIAGYFFNSTILVTSWSLLILFRLFRKPTWFNFFLWGLVVAFGNYIYTAFRLFGFFLVVLTLFWFALNRKKWKTGWVGWSLVSLATGALFLCFLVINHVLSEGFSHALVRPWVLLILAIFLTVFSFKSIFNYVKNGQDEISLKLFSALLLIAVLVYPLASHPAYGMRVATLNIFNNGTNTFTAILDKIGFTFRAHFMGQGIFDTSAFDFQSAWVIFLGIAAFLARPDWKTTILFAAIWVGLSPHFLAIYPYDGRSAVAIAPFWLLGAMGLERLQVWGAQTWNRKTWNSFFALLLFGFFSWQAWTNYQYVYKNVIFGQWIEALVSRQVVKDSPTNRVYLKPYTYGSSPSCQGIMDEGHPLYVFHDKNPIYVKPGEKPKDVVVIVLDPKLKEQLEKEFPQARWEAINFNTFHYPTANPHDMTARFYRVFIPADQIQNGPEKSIYFTPAAENYWVRDFYVGPSGPDHAAINFEDQVESLRAVYPTNEEIQSASFEGVFHAPVDGTYEFSAKDQNSVLLWIGGQKVITLRSSSEKMISEKKTIYLSRGNYPLRYATYFRINRIIPSVQVQTEGSDQIFELDHFTH